MKFYIFAKIIAIILCKTKKRLVRKTIPVFLKIGNTGMVDRFYSTRINSSGILADKSSGSKPISWGSNHILFSQFL